MGPLRFDFTVRALPMSAIPTAYKTWVVLSSPVRGRAEGGGVVVEPRTMADGVVVEMQ